MTFEEIKKEIQAIARAERVTKEKLGKLSRVMLEQVIQDEDVRGINMLLGKDTKGNFILTPVNWRIAVQYFHNFVAFSSNYEKEVKKAATEGGERAPLVFINKNKRKWDGKVQEIESWLADENNDIWTWSNNVKTETKPTDYAKKVQSAVKAAVNPEKGGMDMAALLSTVIETEGVSLDELLASIDRLNQEAA